MDHSNLIFQPISKDALFRWEKELNIYHKDIKPDNILLFTSSTKKRIQSKWPFSEDF